MQIWSLGQEDAPEEDMPTNTSFSQMKKSDVQLKAWTEAHRVDVETISFIQNIYQIPNNY